MTRIFFLLPFLALAQGTLLPIESSSSVNVKSDNKGSHYSYSIQEQKGLQHLIIPHALPLLKTPEIIQAHMEQPLQELKAEMKPQEPLIKTAMPQEVQQVQYLRLNPLAYPYYMPANDYYYLYPQQLHYLPLR